MNRIKDLPVYERPREKAIRFGIETLSNDDLIALLIGTGYRDVSALELAHKIISDNHGLFNLFRLPYAGLLDVKGIGPGKALILSACFELSKRYDASRFLDEEIIDSDILYQRYVSRLRSLNKEVLIVVVLNRKKRIIYEEIVYKGSEKSVDCPPEEIVKKVLIHTGKYFYLIHNHPSGNCLPSDGDISLTTEVMNKAHRLHVYLLDHIIIGSNGYYSFTERSNSKQILSN